MKGKIEGIVIRTVFNNQGWAAPCKKPLDDERCYICKRGILPGINGGNPIEENNGICYGAFGGYAIPEDKWCWEQTLCSEFFWRNIRGKWRQASRGMPVYFVFSEIDKRLTLWGRAEVDSIDNNLVLPTLLFKPFVPLPENKWIHGLTGEEVSGEQWRQGHYRYLDDKHESYLSSLVEKGVKSKKKDIPTITSTTQDTLELKFREDIMDKIEKIAFKEGRDVKDLIREAVAKLIRERGF